MKHVTYTEFLNDLTEVIKIWNATNLDEEPDTETKRLCAECLDTFKTYAERSGIGFNMSIDVKKINGTNRAFITSLTVVKL